VSGPITLDDASLARTTILEGVGLGFFMEPDVRDEIQAGRLIRVLQDWTARVVVNVARVEFMSLALLTADAATPSELEAGGRCPRVVARGRYARWTMRSRACLAEPQSVLVDRNRRIGRHCDENDLVVREPIPEPQVPAPTRRTHARPTGWAFAS
jgi:hypothetical protein